MGRVNRFEDLEAWKLARELTADIYGITSNEKFAQDFGLLNQICRASVSITSNIAEGFERDGDKEFANFLSLAKGSVGEVRSQLYIAKDPNYINENQFFETYKKTQHVARLLANLIGYLRRSNVGGTKFLEKQAKSDGRAVK